MVFVKRSTNMTIVKTKSELAKATTNPETLKKLAASSSQLVKTKVATNPACLPETLEYLASDEAEAVRGSVALNKACPLHVLAKLKKDEAVFVRFMVSRSKLLSQEDLAELAADEDDSVVSSVIRHPDFPIVSLYGFLTSQMLKARESAVIGLKALSDEQLHELAITVLNTDTRMPRDWVLKSLGVTA